MIVEGRYPAFVSGPLAPLVAEFQAELVRRGYTPRTAQDNSYVLAHLSLWLKYEGLAPADLAPGWVDRFVEARRAAGYRRWRTCRSLRLMLGYLRERGAIPPEEHHEIECPVERVLERYRVYLRRERQLAECTTRQRVDVARGFLRARVVDGQLRIDQLDSAAVAGFIVTLSRQYATGSMKVQTSALRSLLRYLFVTGALDRDLTGAVPSVAGWRLSPLHTGADTDAVQDLLSGCNRTTALGRRDFAVLMLMARLGLRAVEVSRLCLEDLDWRSGEVVVRGKGGRVDRLPLPADVGAALADYLRHGRRPSVLREVFLRMCGPDAPMARQSVVMVPRCAARRAGIPAIAAHQLRHRAACQVLAGGGTLAEVAQLLRHHSEETTAIYAKVDMAALAAVVRPWPLVSA